MESDDDLALLSPTEESSPAVPERKLKRLKKAVKVSGDASLSPVLAPVDFAKSDSLEDFDKQSGPDSPGLNEELSYKEVSKGFEDGDELDSDGFDSLGGEEENSWAKRSLEFGSEDDEYEVKSDDLTGETEEGIGDLRMEETENKQRSSVEIVENRENKKREKIESEENVELKDTTTTEGMTQKERRGHLTQLRAESQRLLRESRGVSFRPLPPVQKPISSVLEKIRKRKLEISKKYFAMKSTALVDEEDEVEDEGDDFSTEVIMNCGTGDSIGDERGDNRLVIPMSVEAIKVPANMKTTSGESCKDDSSEIRDHSIHERELSQMDADDKSRQAFQIPVDDTQELLCDSIKSDSKDELPVERPSSPLEEVLAPSILAMNLKLDSAPLDDSFDEEDNDNENTDPQPHGLTELPSSPDGDPVKAFVDDEAEEEDDSDNDLFRFRDNEEEDENEDHEDLNDMIATEYKEKPIDNEKRNELHQKWLEQQDAAGTESLLQKLKCGSKLKDTALVEDEVDEEGDEDTKDFDDEATEDLTPTNVALMNLRKLRQMIPQMFTDKDDPYLSSDDEETAKRLSRQCPFEKSEERATLLSPADDESSREVFGLIKKLNIIPDTKRVKTPSLFDTSFPGGKRSILSKSSFLGRGSTHSLPSSKHASSKVRSFIFGRDDSNSCSEVSVSVSEDSSDTIQRENRPNRPASAKFSNSQAKASAQNTQSVAAMKSSTSLFEILRQSSLKSEHHTRDNMTLEAESVLAAFKLAKKPMKTEGKA